MNKNLLIIALFVTVGVLLYMQNNNRVKMREQTDLVESLNADLKTWKDKDSLNHARIQVIEIRKVKDFITIQTKDSLVKELQNTVKYYKKHLKKQGSATLINTVTDVNTYSKTDIVVKDTSKNYIFPQYKSEFNLEGWVIGNTVANKDSTTINLKIKNSYSVIIGQESQGLFKRPKPFVEVTNKNPFTETEALRTYEVTTPIQKKFGIGPVVGIGSGANGTFQGFIGIGVQYNLIKL